MNNLVVYIAHAVDMVEWSMIYILCVVYSLLSVNCFMVVLARPRGKLVEWDSTISATYEWDAQDRRELECETKRYRRKHRYAKTQTWTGRWRGTCKEGERRGEALCPHYGSQKSGFPHNKVSSNL